MEPDAGDPHDPNPETAVYPEPRLGPGDVADLYRYRGTDGHPLYRKMLGFVALPAAYFAYLIPCILLYMVLATSIKKAYVRHFGELL